MYYTLRGTLYSGNVSDTGYIRGNVVRGTLTIPENYRTNNILLEYSRTLSPGNYCRVNSGPFSYRTDLDGENDFHTLSSSSSYIDLTGATLLECRVYVEAVVTNPHQSVSQNYVTSSVTCNLTVYLPWGIETETIITADKINEIASALNQNISPTPTVGLQITRAQYQTLAEAAEIAAFDTITPLSTDLTALITAANRKIQGSWN